MPVRGRTEVARLLAGARSPVVAVAGDELAIGSSDVMLWNIARIGSQQFQLGLGW